MAAPFKFSPQQEAIYSWIKTGTGSAIVVAVAGAGKTTTLVHAVSLMEGTVFFGAYNKKIALEIEARITKRPGLFVSTMHAAGFKAWRRVAPDVKVNDNKCRDIFRDACGRHPQYAPFEGPVLSLVSYAKQAAFGVITPLGDNNAWLNLIDHFNVDCTEEDVLCIKLAKKVLQASYDRDMVEVDFDGMIYAPLIHKARMYEHDWVLIDEAQDTNAARRALALRMLKRGGRLIAVGDPRQAIYGFTGADALDLIKTAVNAIELPLTITYRCPKTVVAHAQTWTLDRFSVCPYNYSYGTLEWRAFEAAHDWSMQEGQIAFLQRYCQKVTSSPYPPAPFAKGMNQREREKVLREFRAMYAKDIDRCIRDFKDFIVRGLELPWKRYEFYIDMHLVPCFEWGQRQ